MTTFSDEQYELFYPPGFEYHWWAVARNQLLAKIIQRETGKSAVLLEVGCGKGVVVKSLNDSGFNIHGVELADVIPLEGAQHLVDASTDAFDWAVEHGAEITALLLLDVIEHLPEPEQFLKRLEGSFPNLAVVIITVPARQELWSHYDDSNGHYRRYSLEMLETLAVNLHWTTQYSGYFFRVPYLLMRLMYMFGIARDEKIHSPGKAMRSIHRLVSAACQLEQAILPRRIRGSSAYAVYYPIKAGQR
jgi:hypothetical protein